MAVNSSLEAKKVRANNLVQQILDVRKSATSALKDVNTLFAQIEKKDKNYKVLISKLDVINANTTDALDGFSKEIKAVERALREVNNFYEKRFSPLVNKIEDPATGLKVKIREGEQLSRHIKQTEKDLEIQYDSVLAFIKEFKSNSKELKSIDITIRRLHGRTLKYKQDSEALLSAIKVTEKETSVLLRTIKEYANSSKKTLDSIVEVKVDSISELDVIRNNSEEAKKKLKEIQDIYEISHETGLSGEFEKRRNQLKTDLSRWESKIEEFTIALFIGILVLFVAQLWLYDGDISEQNFDTNFYVRFLIFSPIVFYIAFCSSQYQKTKKLYDKYSFKTTLAMSIKAHIEMFSSNEHFQDAESIVKTLDFTLDSFKKIYTEPYTDDGYKVKLKMANLEINLQKKILDKLKKIEDVKLVND